jgi:hypothetical protein
MSDKKYINKCSIKQKVFEHGGSVLNCSFKLEELKEHVTEDGWIRITIAERRSTSEKGQTHYAYVDNYVPKGRSESTPLPTGEDIPF